MTAPVPQLPPSPQPPALPVAVVPRQTESTAYEVKAGPGMLVRAVWFVLVGWWATGIVSTIAWAAMITIIGLPLGIWLINRIPTVLTLRPRTQLVTSWTDAQGYARASVAKIPQQPWWIRGLWFLVVGWWASALTMAVGLALVVLIVTLPIGLMIYNRVPFVASLYRY